MGVFDLIRRSLASPATRRLRLAEHAAEVWASTPAPSTALALRAASPPQGPPKNPSIDWMRDQPPPPPRNFSLVPGYSDHTYQQFSAPLAFDGFSLDRIRAAVTAHRIGIFWETSALVVAVLGFAPVLAALKQAIAPILALPRHVRGGDRGLAKLVAGEVEEALVPRGGLLPSPFFPPTLWGWTAIQLRMMGFGNWQHADGDPDPETGVRPRFTRPWEPWAIQRQRSPRKTIAYTTEGAVEVLNDGKFTLIESTIEGHLFDAAICALGEPTLGGKLTDEARNSFLDFFGKPKLWAKLPPNVPTEGQAGDAFLASVNTIYGPDGRGILPDGADLRAVGITGEGASAFSPALMDAIVHIFMVLTGSAGTIGNGMASGAGEGHGYQPAKGGSWDVKHGLVADPVKAIEAALNVGHVAPYLDVNYAEGIRAARRAGAWTTPVIAIPLTSPERDDRIKGDIERHKALVDQIKAEQAVGAPPSQERVKALADRFEVLAFDLPTQAITEKDVEAKLFAPDEVRHQRGYGPLPSGAGSVQRLAEERLKGGDETGAIAKVESAEVTKEQGDGAEPQDQDHQAGPAPQASDQASGG